MFNLQKQMRVLKDQLKKKDLLVEFLKRKIKLLEDSARGKCALQVSQLPFCLSRCRLRLPQVVKVHILRRTSATRRCVARSDRRSRRTERVPSSLRPNVTFRS